MAVEFVFDSFENSRKKLFQTALSEANNGKVLYILPEELTSLPELSQEINGTNRILMQLITFLYTKTLESLLESVSIISEWKNVPNTIILDNLHHYCNRENLHAACGVIAMLMNAAESCAVVTKKDCKVIVFADTDVVSEEYCTLLQQLFA